LDIAYYLFASFANRPWYIEGIKGTVFIKKEFEDHPFVKKFIIPNCLYVSPYFKYKNLEKGEYEDVHTLTEPLTNDEFRDLFNNKGKQG